MTKRSKFSFLAMVACLPLVLLSCIGGGQPTGGWSGSTIHNGVIYVGTRDGRVVAINASSREEEWQWPESTGVRSLIYATPAVNGDSVYVGTYSGEVYALDIADGEYLWVYPAKGEGYIGAVVGSPVIANEIIYASSSDGKVYALNTSNGKRKWETDGTLAEKLWTSPAVARDRIYVSTFDGHIYTLSTETGELLDWSFQAEAGFTSSPVIGEDTIYVGSFDRYLYAIRIGSNVSMWRFPEQEPAGNWFWAPPIVNEGVVYAGCLDGMFYAIAAGTGEELWKFGTAAPIVAPPVLTGELLVIIDESGNVYVFDISNEFGDEAVPLRVIPIGASVRSSFCAQGDLIYVRAEDDSVYVVDIGKGEIVEGWPLSLATSE